MQIFFKLDFFQENEPVSLLKEGRIFLGPRGPLVLPLVNQPARAKNLDTQIQAYICLMNHQETHQTNPVQSSTAQYSLVPPSTVQYQPVQSSTAQYSLVLPSTVQYRPVQSSTSQYNPVRPSTV